MVTARTLPVLAALALLAPVAGLQAAPQWGAAVPRQGYSAPSAAYDQGYQRGLRAGEEDGRRGQTFNFSDETDYRRADTGYRSQYGDRNRYRDGFRTGFESGYRAGYSRYGYNSRPGQYPYGNGRGAGAYGNYGGVYGSAYNFAAQSGFDDGYEQGLKDGRSRHENDPIAESWYRNGDRGYNSRYGSRDVYKANYRNAFVQGYERGYRDGWSYR
jgi:hypothetical protein